MTDESIGSAIVVSLEESKTSMEIEIVWAFLIILCLTTYYVTYYCDEIMAIIVGSMVFVVVTVVFIQDHPLLSLVVFIYLSILWYKIKKEKRKELQDKRLANKVSISHGELPLYPESE